MRIVVQRVKSASVLIGGETATSIGKGLLLFVGFGRGDREEDAAYLAEKTAGLRIFEDSRGRMNLSCADVGGEVLIVSQFTLYGDCRKGRRPSFAEAMEPVQAKVLYEKFTGMLKRYFPAAKSGVFQAMMDVCIVNDGPVTLLLDSKRLF